MTEAIVQFSDCLPGGTCAFGNITSIRVVDTDGIQPVFIVAGSPDPDGKVPEFNGVSGSGVANLDIAVPITALTHGNSYVYTLALYDVNFTGTCQASFTLTQIQYNKTVTVDSGKDGAFSPTPLSYWAYVFNGKVIPNYPGPATLTGTVTCGTVKETITSTVVFQ